jgi:integrase
MPALAHEAAVVDILGRRRPSRVPELKARNKPKRVVPADEALRQIEAVPEKDRALRATAFLAGPRNGELQALRVEDVELFPEGRWGVIHVREGWDKKEGAQEPKSTATARMPVCEQLFDYLSEHLLRLDRTEGLIFGRTAETAYSYSGVYARAKRAGVLDLHERRHSYSSYLADAGIPQERRNRYRGHSDNPMDARYTHQLDHQYLDDAQALSDYLARADTPTRVRTSAHQ